MGIDGKYGQVTTERGTIGVDEPVIVFRAQDKMLPQLLDEYVEMCLKAGSPAHHIKAVNDQKAVIIIWQASHFHKVPTSDMLAP